jgi:hypothetical protein
VLRSESGLASLASPRRISFSPRYHSAAAAIVPTETAHTVGTAAKMASTHSTCAAACVTRRSWAALATARAARSAPPRVRCPAPPAPRASGCPPRPRRPPPRPTRRRPAAWTGRPASPGAASGPRASALRLAARGRALRNAPRRKKETRLTVTRARPVPPAYEPPSRSQRLASIANIVVVLYCNGSRWSHRR